MVGSTVAFLIFLTLRLWWGSKVSMFSWMSKVLTVLNWAMIVCIGVFCIFVVIEIVKAIERRSRRRDR